MEEDHYEAGNAAGWPLGLPPVTLQMRLANAFSSALHPAYSSFLLATPTSSSLGSSDLDTESSLFSFQARSITLGSLIGMRSGREPSLIRARSLAAANSCSQVSTSHPHHHQYHRSCRALELCRKLVRRQQFKCIAMVSVKLYNTFLIRCAACIQLAQHKQSRSSSPRLQAIDQDVVAVTSLAHLLQADRVPMQTLHNTVLINIMYEGVDNPAEYSGAARQCDMKEVGMVNSRGKSNSKGTSLSVGSIKKRVKRKYREWEAHSKSPCIPCCM